MATQHELDMQVYRVVALYLDKLDVDALAGLQLVTMLGTDPRNCDWYPQVKGLYESNGTTMHEMTRNAVLAYQPAQDSAP